MSDPEVVPVAPDMVVSETLGGYDLLRRLGSGGMAEVHLARANGIEGFQKLVVLKQILPHLSRDKHFVRMFLEEARLAALLDHPNVVQVFDLGKEEGEYFFTMEFVYGENLSGLIKGLRKVGQPLAFEHVVTIGLGVAAGLHYAHERVGFDGRPLGIVHRDVSPTNVMITYEGGVKVADFGIAKVVTRTDVTRAGTRKGKVPYMSPEQCRAEKIDRRSDVFSLGIVLWEAATGERLFEGDNEFGVMNLIVNGHMKRPSAVRPDVPPGLEAIIMKALTVDRNERYPNARALQLDLETLARDQKLRATPSALGELMHYLFRPQPFPWGALRGSSGKGVMSPATIAEISSMLGSQPAIPGTGAGSYGSQVLSSNLGTGASIGTLGTSGGGSRVISAGPVDPRGKALNKVAIGLGSAAALALVLVLGVWLGGRGAAEETAEAKAAADEATEQLQQAEAAAARAAEPLADGRPEPEPEPQPEPEPEPEPEPQPAAGGSDSGGDEGSGGSGELEAVVADDEGDDEAGEVSAEDDVVIVDDEPVRKETRKTGGSKSPRTSTPKKTKRKTKKPDLDSFMPGMG